MKKCFYAVFAALVAIALVIIGNRYMQNYEFNKNLQELTALGLQADKQTEELMKSVAQASAYQIMYADELIETKIDPDVFMKNAAKEYSQGILDEDKIVSYTQEILKQHPLFTPPQADSDYAQKMIVKGPQEKAVALNETLKKQKALADKMIYELKEKEMPYDALTWAYIATTQNIPADKIDSIFANWIGDEKQNMRLAERVKNYLKQGKVRPLTKKEEAFQRFYSDRMSLVINPVLQDKKQIAALTPEKCTDLIAEYFANQINENNFSQEAINNSLKEWNRDENYKKMFNDKLQNDLKEKKLYHFTYLEFMQFNTCNAKNQ